MHSQRNETDQWFIRRGLPHLIEPYGTGPDVWSRASPVLLVAYDRHCHGPAIWGRPSSPRS